MSRTSYLLFCFLLSFSVYGMIQLNYATRPADLARVISFSVIYFSGPFVCINLALGLLMTIRWFLKTNDELIRGAVTFLHATWFSALSTYVIVKLVSGELHAGLASISHGLIK